VHAPDLAPTYCTKNKHKKIQSRNTLKLIGFLKVAQASLLPEQIETLIYSYTLHAEA